VPPVVAEIVGVNDLCFHRGGYLCQGCLGLVLPRREVLIVRWPELSAGRLERVQVVVMPFEGDLHYLMQLVEWHALGISSRRQIGGFAP
jgi:hypothetical protein